MLTFTRRLSAQTAHSYTLTLPFDQRIKGRLKVTLDDGTEAGIMLDRGPIMRGGDCLSSEDGQVVKIVAAAETVSVVRSDNTLLLARACYHLGNRHTPLQIKPGMACYQHDHVLDNMVAGLGLTAICEQVAFEPEPGAYGEHHRDHAAGGHSHGHSHAH